MCTACAPPLVYRTGPVMSTAGLTLTAVYWAPQGYSYPDGYVALINQYIADVAAASGKTDNTYAINAEYGMLNNGSPQYIKNQVQATAPITDTTAYPAPPANCQLTAPATACLDDPAIQTELGAQIKQASLTADLGHMFLMFYPPNVLISDGTSTGGFCGYHASWTLPDSGGIGIYANEPFLADGCLPGQTPNGNRFGDAEVSILSHEISEAVTDPLSKKTGTPGWFDPAGNEIGDECNFNFGPPLGSADPANPQTTLYNQVLNGHNYYTQTQFSNVAYKALGIGRGCVGAPVSATAASSQVTTTVFHNANPLTNDPPAQATVNLAETRLPADGAATTKATITEVDAAGEPVVGDHVHWDIQADVETSLHCGTISPADGVTDANGQVAATYTASTNDVACVVIGNDAEAGASDWATVYQGTTAADQPGITDAGVPSSVSPGGAPQTFTVTASNPSKSDLKDVRFDVLLSGDGNQTTGLTAKQVHISYSVPNNGSGMSPIQLSGETVKNGEISGSASMDQGADIPAGGSVTATFQVTIDAGAPTSAATGAPLHLEIDVDEFNPADGTANNLDYVGPVDVAVG